MSTPTANWSYPTAVRFGAGRIKELADACRAAGISRPLLVTDAGLAKLAITERTLRLLKEAGLPVAMFSDVQSNPVEANVESGIAAFRAGNHDGVVAFGGGSGLDTGKVIAFAAGQTRPLWDFEDVGDWWTRADADRIAPVVAVPTTAGTGSEVGRAGVITQEATQTKKVIFHPKMMPRVVICDPELTAGMPPAITAGTGMDALAHCLEAYCAVGYHPMADGIAVEGMRLIFENLPKAVANGNDLEARAHMMSAAAMGAAAFQKGLGAIHALSHPVGALYHTHHGTTNAVFMPYVLVFNGVRSSRRLRGSPVISASRAGSTVSLTRCSHFAKRPGSRTTLADSRSTAARPRQSPKWPLSIRPPAATPFPSPRREAANCSKRHCQAISPRPPKAAADIAPIRRRGQRVQ